MGAKVTYVQIVGTEEKCDGCGAAFENGEMVSMVTFERTGASGRICDDCHDSLAEQMND